MRFFGRNVQLPWESTAADSGIAVLTPLGTPVSQGFTVIGGAEVDPIRHTLAVIDVLHGDGDLPSLHATNDKLEGLNGQFIPGQGILISPQSPISEFATAHEIGHVLDFYGFVSGRCESLSGHAMAPIFDAWFVSISCRELQTLRVQLSTLLIDPAEYDCRQKDFERVNYLLRLEEVWSRAYAQWVATSSQDPVLLSQLETIRHDPAYSRFFVQWSEADFLRIGREIDLLFQRKGWIS